MRRGGQLGGAGALQKHRMGEPLNPCDIHSGSRGDLLNGRTGADL